MVAKVTSNDQLAAQASAIMQPNSSPLPLCGVKVDEDYVKSIQELYDSYNDAEFFDYYDNETLDLKKWKTELVHASAPHLEFIEDRAGSKTRNTPKISARVNPGHCPEKGDNGICWN